MTLTEDQIKFIGVDDLLPSERASLNQLSTQYFEKLKRAVHNVNMLEVHIKSHEKEGDQRKFSIHAKLHSPGHTFISDRAVDWDFRRAIHKAYNDLMVQAEKLQKGRP